MAIAPRYHNLNCCDHTLGADALLTHYQQDRAAIVKMMMTDPESLIKTIWKIESPLAIDNNCHCRVGQGDRLSKSICAQCKNLKRLIDFRVGGPEKPFIIQSGAHIGKSLIINKYELPHPYLAFDEQAAIKCKGIIARYQHIVAATIPTKFVSGDIFTMEILMTLLLQQQFMERGLPHIIPLQTAFICNHNGYLIRDYLATSPRITTTIIRTLMLQLLVILTELRTINFTHRLPVLSSLALVNEPVSYSYNNKPIQGPITVKLLNLAMTTATVNNIHYFAKVPELDIILNKSTFMPEIETKVVNNNNYYRMSMEGLMLYQNIRHLGVALYAGSFEWYSFIVSIMCEKEYYDMIMANEDTRRWWQHMWTDPDLIEITARLQNVHENTTNIPRLEVHLLKKLWLRRDILDQLWLLL